MFEWDLFFIVPTKRCSELNGARGIAKSSLPVQQARQEQIAAVRAVLLKKPAKSPGILRRKRTPFSLKREGSLILGGSKLAIYRGNTPSVPAKRPAKKMVKKRPSSKTSAKKMVKKRPSSKT